MEGDWVNDKTTSVHMKFQELQGPASQNASSSRTQITPEQLDELFEEAAGVKIVKEGYTVLAHRLVLLVVTLSVAKQSQGRNTIV
ncbi:hypothetical protein M9H77_18297 [Catharanthus roseus]|uniref:Uncharacterized protein n=1 Tax=Catharanthus roseus TaxID=4058 RepID=A0ACC0B718_CATRO|nr:hypothetical protein M9H77_18297 [Catharanthus roseus]